jgi:hypothetical protein
MRALDALTLCAIAAVVLLVSLPRLREFALRENESDAQSLVKRLGDSLNAQPAPAADVRALLESTASLSRQLDDAELSPDGRTLRRHGYLFELAREGGEPAVRAWPWKHGQTGVAAFCWSASRGLTVDANRSGAWSGPDHPPPLALADAR